MGWAGATASADKSGATGKPSLRIISKRDGVVFAGPAAVIGVPGFAAVGVANQADFGFFGHCRKGAFDVLRWSTVDANRDPIWLASQ